MSEPSEAAELAARFGAPAREVRRVTPMLCASDESSARILGEPGHLFELKLDGVRIVAEKRGALVSLTYRKLRDATPSYLEIADAVAALPEPDVVLDGEIVAFDAAGQPDFQLLSQRIQSRGRGHPVPVTYVVFDVLSIAGKDLRSLPIEARKAILERVVPEGSRWIRVHPTFDDGAKLFELCREHRLEGVVAKRAGSTYRTGDRSSDWVKVKCERDADLVVVAYTEGEGKRSRLGALDVASFEGDRLVLRGAVGSGLDEPTIDLLLDTLEEVPKRTAEGRFTSSGKTRHHVRPSLVVSIRYASFTADGTMRFPVFRGIRADVRPEDCTVSPTSLERRIHLTGGTAEKDAWCTHYERVAPELLASVVDRACSLVGRAGVLWPLPKWTPSWVKTSPRGVIVDSLDVLHFAIEAGCHGLRMAAVRESRPSHVDFMAFRGGRARELLGNLGLACFSSTADEVIAPLGGVPLEVGRALAALVARLADAEVLPNVAVPLSLVDPDKAAFLEGPERYAWGDPIDIGRAIAAIEAVAPGSSR